MVYAERQKENEMKDKFFGSLRNNFKQLDFFVAMIVFFSVNGSA